MEDVINDNNKKLPKAFIKLGKFKYMNNYIKNGELRFSPAKVFTQMEESKDKIADSHEGSLFSPVFHIVVAPIIGIQENGKPIYGKGNKIADNAELIEIDNTLQSTPFHCLYCYNNDAMNTIIKLENYNDIIKDFPEYDSAVIIYNPTEFINRIESKFQIYYNNVIYTDSTPSRNEIKKNIHTLFYKRKIFEQQKEFRIALTELRINKAENYNIGSLEDIAYCLPLKYLREGIIIAENEDILKKLKMNVK